MLALRISGALCAFLAGTALASDPAPRAAVATPAEDATGVANVEKPGLPKAVDSPVEMVSYAQVAADGSLSVECAERTVAGSKVRYGVVHDHVDTVEE